MESQPILGAGGNPPAPPSRLDPVDTAYLVIGSLVLAFGVGIIVPLTNTIEILYLGVGFVLIGGLTASLPFLSSLAAYREVYPE